MGRVHPLRTNRLCAPIALAPAAPPAAAPPLVLKAGQVTTRHDRFAGQSGLPAAPPQAARSHGSVHAARAVRAARAPKGRATRQALDALLGSGAIDQRTHDADRAS